MYKLLMAVGIVVMFLVGTIIGIQFMIASAEDKAKVKEALIPYIVGCMVIFGAFSIWSIAVNIGQDVIPSSGGGGGPSSGGGGGPSRNYNTQTGTWYWCRECDRELSETEKRDQQCNVSRSHDVYVKTERYYCAKCGDEWDEGEKRQQSCDNCR